MHREFQERTVAKNAPPPCRVNNTNKNRFNNNNNKSEVQKKSNESQRPRLPPNIWNKMLQEQKTFWLGCTVNNDKKENDSKEITKQSKKSFSTQYGKQYTPRNMMKVEANTMKDRDYKKDFEGIIWTTIIPKGDGQYQTLEQQLCQAICLEN